MNPAALFIAMRPWQWLKNVVVFAALIFAQLADDPRAVGLAVLAFFSFCLMSSAGYLLNDLKDLPLDRKHPSKCRRPLAAGKISPAAALLLALVLAAGGIGLAWIASDHTLPLGERFVLLPPLYLALSLSYSMFLKRLFLVDVLVIAMGFLLRVIGGGVALGVETSSWLLVSTFFMALFLGLGKRRSELGNRQRPEGAETRPVLASYSRELLNVLISSAAAALLVSYVLYTVSERAIQQFGGRGLIFTIPFAFYGVGRYLALVMRGEEGEDAAVVFWHDRPLQIAVLLWLATVGVIVY